MVAGILRAIQAALQIRHGSVQDRGAMFRAIEAEMSGPALTKQVGAEE